MKKKEIGFVLADTAKVKIKNDEVRDNYTYFVPMFTKSRIYRKEIFCDEGK